MRAYTLRLQSANGGGRLRATVSRSGHRYASKLPAHRPRLPAAQLHPRHVGPQML